MLGVVAQAREAVLARPLLAIALTNAGTACIGFVVYARSQGGVLKVFTTKALLLKTVK